MPQGRVSRSRKKETQKDEKKDLDRGRGMQSKTHCVLAWCGGGVGSAVRTPGHAEEQDVYGYHRGRRNRLS